MKYITFTTERLAKYGNAEKFYSTIALNALKHFEGLSWNAATLLSTKVADCMLAHYKERVETATPDLPTKLSDEEKPGLQYIGGYVLHTLHNKHAKDKKNWLLQRMLNQFLRELNIILGLKLAEDRHNKYRIKICS